MNHLYKEIEMIRQRPGMYIGKNSITVMYHYLCGFTAALHRLGEGKAAKLLPLPYMFFNDYVSNHYYKKQSAMGWCGLILEENDKKKKKSLDVFFELFSNFMALSIRHCQYDKISGDAVSYHHTSEYAPKIIRQHDEKPTKAICPQDYKPEEPLYLNPVEVYLIELSDAGYMFMVNTDSQHRVERKIYISENEAKDHIRQCFGPYINWNEISIGNNIDFTMEVVNY
jgi:hypothetical protein